MDTKGTTSLSRSEQEFLALVAEGLSNREIAERLKLDVHTVKNCLFRIFEKLRVSNRVEAVLYALRTSKPLEARGVRAAWPGPRGRSHYKN